MRTIDLPQLGSASAPQVVIGRCVRDRIHAVSRPIVIVASMALSLFAMTIGSQAQGVLDCNAAIVKDNYAYSADIITKLTFLQTLSENSYNNMTDNKDIGLTIPIDDIPVKFDGNWKSYKQQISNVFKHSGIRLIPSRRLTGAQLTCRP